MSKRLKRNTQLITDYKKKAGIPMTIFEKPFAVKGNTAYSFKLLWKQKS